MRPAAALGRRTLPRVGEIARQPAALLRRMARGPSPAWRRRLLALVLMAGLLGAGYLLWFRDSSFVRVERVRVSGLSGTDAPRQRAALVAAAKGMTTLHVDEAALRRALGAGATVEALRVTTEFPHGLRIEVVEKAPVAVLVYGSERVAVGAGGVLLPDVRPLPRGLPEVQVGALPGGARLGHGRARKLVAAAAAAPVPLRPRITRLRLIPAKGLVADLRDGPDVILGSTADLRAKWTAAAAILADATSRGASYVDVRLPGRPVAGGLDLPSPSPEDQTIVPPAPEAAVAPETGATGAATTPGAATAEPSASPATTAPPQAPAGESSGTTPPPTGGTPTGTP